MESTTLLPLESLHESPFNPRKTYSEAGLRELAESIKSQGVMQPIVVRIVEPMRMIDGIELFNYQIVFGHRRYRAAKLAGLEAIPAIVRDMTDEQAAIAQLHENLEREDVSAIEEADAFQRLMDEHKVSITDLILQTGKSRTYIYNRLKLASLGDHIRKACLEGNIGGEIATLIARIPKSLQLDALKRCQYQDYGQEGHPWVTRSFRDCKAALQRAFTVPIFVDGVAPFDHMDATLVEGAPGCVDCPRNSTKEPVLADDLGSDVCTNPPCHEKKIQAHQARELAAARLEGRVIEGEEAAALFHGRMYGGPDGYTTTHGTIFSGEVDGRWERIDLRDAMDRLRQSGYSVPDTTLIARPQQKGKGVDYFEAVPDEKVTELRSALMKLMGVSQSDDDQPSEGIRHLPAVVDERPIEVRAVLACDPWHKVRMAMLQRVRSAPRSREDLQEMLLRELDLAGEFSHLVIHLFGWTAELEASEESGAFLRSKLMQLSADDLAAFLMASTIVDMTTSLSSVADQAEQDWLSARRLAMAKRYGVDVIEASGLGEQKFEAGSAGGQVDAFEETGV